MLKEIFNGFDDEIIGVRFCRDFPGHESSIIASLKHCITHIHGKKITKVCCKKLPSSSDAHRYAKMMNSDVYNFLPTYVNISLEQIEPFLMWRQKRDKD